MSMTTLVAGVGPSEYLAAERVSETKHEWRDGEIYEMPGVKRQHSRIQTNLAWLCREALSGTSCEFHGSDLKVRAERLYSYPDGAIACDAVFEDGDDVLTNPVVLFEILSPSTEAYDRGEKFRRYGAIPSLQDYVLITPESPVVEVLSRTVDGWTLRFFTSLEAVARVPSVSLDLPSAKLYS